MIGELHDLRCTNDPCVCERVFRVREGYNSIVGVSDEPDTVSRDAASVLTPLAPRRRVHGSKP